MKQTAVSVSSDGRCYELPTWAVKAALRLAQIAQEPGEYRFVLVVAENGRKQLKPPPKVEDLGH